MEPGSFREEIDALDEDRAALPTAGWTATRVRGSEALSWLNDLVTADL